MPESKSVPDYDPFDPEDLAGDVLSDIDVKKLLSTVNVRKPKRTEFVRVHPEFFTQKVSFEHEDNGDRVHYLVTKDVQHLMEGETRAIRIYLAINKSGTAFLWPIKVPRDDTRVGREAFDTAVQAAESAKAVWTRVAWNKGAGGYDIFVAKGDLGSPDWPPYEFRELIEKGFKHRLIDHADHPIILELAGEK